MKKHCIIIRTHFINEQIQNLASQLSNIFKIEDIFTAIDASKWSNEEKARHKSHNSIIIDKQEINLLELPYFEKWGWQCGDYFLYATAKKTSYEYYWMIEPDVGFDTNDFSSLIEKTYDSSVDFLAVGHGKRAEDWYWSKTLAPNIEKFGCLFPLTRTSRRALNFLIAERILLGKCLNESPNSTNWPNDEAFLSSTLEANRFTCKDLRRESSIAFENFTTTIPQLQQIPRQKGIAHPVLTWEEFKEKFPAKISNNYKSGGQQMHFLDKSLRGLSHNQTVEVIDLALKKILER